MSTACLGTIVSGAFTGSAGTIIDAGVAGTFTTAFGESYITTLYVLTKNNSDRLPGVEQIRDEFLRQLKSFQKKPPKLER